jgi:hypothetical protein
MNTTPDYNIDKKLNKSCVRNAVSADAQQIDDIHIASMKEADQ